MNGAIRAIAAALLLCGGIVAAFAQELSLRQPDGKVVTVVDDQGVGGPLMQWIERRNPDGSLDLAFGTSGRVSFSLKSADILEPRSLAIDAQGRLILSGSAVGAAERSAVVVSRFLPDGRIDSRWGTQGTSHMAPPAQGAARAVDALALPDQGLLLLGQIDAAGVRSVVLWRLRLDGAVDAGFGRDGVLRLAPLDGAQPVGLRHDDDGSVLIAVQRAQGREAQLEAHRWWPPGDGLKWVARQAWPAGWRGPVTLERRDGRWQWLDADTTGTQPLAFVDEGDTGVAPSGTASTFPFALGDTAASPASILASDRGLAQALPWALTTTVALLLGLFAWRRHGARIASLPPAGMQAALVDTALRELQVSSSTPSTDPVAPDRPQAQAEAARRVDIDAATALAPAQPDDLTRIKGIGPVLAERLHREGIVHFRQIAQWQPEDVRAIAARLSAFRGRIERDRWVAQAIELRGPAR